MELFKEGIGFFNAFITVVLYILFCHVLPSILHSQLSKYRIKNIILQTMIYAVPAFLYFYLVFTKLHTLPKYLTFSFISLLLSICITILLYLLLHEVIIKLTDKYLVKSTILYYASISLFLKEATFSKIYVLLISPITDDLMFRYLLLTTLKPTYGLVLSVLITTILYAIIHLNFAQGIRAFTENIFFSVIFILSSSILITILCNIIYTLISYYKLKEKIKNKVKIERIDNLKDLEKLSYEEKNLLLNELDKIEKDIDLVSIKEALIKESNSKEESLQTYLDLEKEDKVKEPIESSLEEEIAEEIKDKNNLNNEEEDTINNN